MRLLRRVVPMAMTLGVMAMLGVMPAQARYGGDGGNPPVIALSATVVNPGGGLTVQGANFTPTGSVVLTLHSAPVLLATLRADSQGSFAVTVTVPPGTAAGGHTVEALDAATGDVATASLTVDEIPIDLPPPPLAGTGVAVTALAGTGLVLVLCGIALLASARRRSATRG